MIWWILFALFGLVIFITFSRLQAPKQTTLKAMRGHFQNVARMRLIAACPGLEGVLTRIDLRLVFDWIVIELYRRTGTSEFGELMLWSAKREEEFTHLTGEVTREAVERLPQPALAVLDECRGRTFAAVVIDEALTLSSQRLMLARDRA